MSAPADSTMSGGNAASGDTARLDQPTDAVPMEAIPNSTVLPVAAGKNGDEATAAAPASNAAPAIDAGPSDQAATDDSASPKGNGNEDDGAAPPPPLKERSDSVMAIGPSEDDIKAVTPGAPDAGPVCNITLLLTSGGRHPYKIDSKYLARRSVAIPEETEAGLPDPFSISIYTLKELILREWRSDWAGKPASPSSIRLIHFGKLLDDKEPLRSRDFPF